MVFRQVGNDTDKLISKFGILNKSFDNIKIDFQNGQGIRSLGNIVSKQDAANFEKFQQDLKDGISYHKAFNNNLAQSHTYVQQQAVRLRELNIQQKLLDRQLKTNKITQAEYKTAMSANQAQVESLTTQTQTLTLAQKASAIASKAMGTALKVALNVGLMLAINAIISGIINLVNKQDEAKQKAEELKQKTIENAEAAKEETSKIADLISQYEKYKDVTSLTADDKENLKSIQDELIKTFPKEAEGIDLVNGKYEEMSENLKKIARDKLDAAEDTLISNRNQAKKDLHTDDSNVIFESSDASDDLVKLINEAYPGMISSEIKKSKLKVELYGLTDAQQKIEAIQSVLDKMKSAGYDDIQLFTDLTSKRDEYQKNVDAYNESISGLADNYISLYSLDNPIDTTAASKETYQSWKDGLLKQFEDDKELQSEIESRLNQNGSLSAAPALFDTEIQTVNVSEAEKNLNKYSETTKDFIAEKEKLNKAMLEQAENGSISESTAIDLIESGYSDGIKYDKQTKSYRLLTKAIKERSEAKHQDTIETLKNERANNSAYISRLIDRYDEIEDKKSTISNAGDAKYYQEQQAEILKNIDTIDSLNHSYSLYIASLESSPEAMKNVSDNISNLTDNIQKYSDVVGKLDNTKNILSTAQKEQEENGRLSASTIKALTEAGYSNALSYNELTGETTLLTESINALTKAQIASQKTGILYTLSEAKSRLKDINKEYDKLRLKDPNKINYSQLKQLYNEKTDYEKAIEEMQTDLMMLDAYTLELQIGVSSEQSAEETAEEYIKSVKEAFEKEKNNLDYYLDMDMISQEEYYNQLTQLNEKYFKGKEEFLDEYRQYEVEVYKGLKQIQEEQTEKQINSLKEAFNKEKSELDHLNSMNAISQEDYYNKLFELNEKYFKGKTELLDEYRQYEEEVYKGLKEIQIKALQEQIDALKSVNEEKQEEIDLEKAKQALENAKRNKTVKVYDSERGWIRETDRNAIDSAQKEYDDLVLNEKVETLENLIDAIENGTNTSHKLDESVNAVEQVNSLGQRVISGNVDLTQLFSGAVASRMNEIQNSVNSNTPIALANQFDKGISSDSYTTNNNNTITLNGVTVMANNPEEFISQMEQIANESFKENFPAAMNQFGRDLKRYKMNHSL